MGEVFSTYEGCKKQEAKDRQRNEDAAAVRINELELAFAPPNAAELGGLGGHVRVQRGSSLGDINDGQPIQLHSRDTTAGRGSGGGSRGVAWLDRAIVSWPGRRTTVRDCCKLAAPLC